MASRRALLPTVARLRAARERHWVLEPDQLEVAHRYLDLISMLWDAALRRLQKLVEKAQV